MGIIQSIFLFLRAFIMGRAAAAVENLALRQQVAVLKQSVKRPKLRLRDRVFWVLSFPPLAKLAFCPGYRPARNRHQMAAEGLQTVLEMEVEQGQTRATAHRTQDP